MSALGKLLHPIYSLISGLMAFYYSLIPEYAVAIGLLTLTVMVVTLPLTIKSTHSMVANQRLQPEITKIRQKYKNDRIKQQEEMAALFKEHNANPAGGCLPMVLQFPIFIVLYEVIRGLTAMSKGRPSPKYISHHALLYTHLVAAKGTMVSFGLDLARSATSVHGGFLVALPYYLLVAFAILLQYLQMHQLMSRNQPAAAGANQQVQQIQKLTPLIFGFVYISFPAAVTVYFIVSNIFRIVQQTLMYRFDPVLKTAAAGAGAAGTVIPAEVKVQPDDQAKKSNGARPAGQRPAGGKRPDSRGTPKSPPGSRRGPADGRSRRSR